MKNGAEYDIVESSILTYYAEIWYKIESQVDDRNKKEIIFRQLDSLFQAHYNLYGYGSR